MRETYCQVVARLLEQNPPLRHTTARAIRAQCVAHLHSLWSHSLVSYFIFSLLYTFLHSSKKKKKIPCGHWNVRTFYMGHTGNFVSVRLT